MKTIDGAPETITHAQAVSACELLGFDPKSVRSIRMNPHFVEVVLYATKPVKLLLWDVPATHTIYYDLSEPDDD